MSHRRLLIVYAHPDDESFGNGGMIARYVAEGVQVFYICATDGDMGTIPEEMQAQYATVRELRLAELDCAAQVLGFSEVVRLGYRDSGMMGSSSTEDPACLWYQHQHDHETLVRQVVAEIRRIQPQVIVTFNRYGGYGHPDHIAIQRATTDAFYRAGSADYDIPGTRPYQPQKLYYSALPRLFLRLMLFMLRLRGKDPRRMGVNQDIDFQAVVDHVEPAHTMIELGNYLDAWDEASACHKSQGGGRISSMPRWLRRLVFSRQGYTRIEPRPQRNVVDERDLFAGVVAQPVRQEMTP